MQKIIVLFSVCWVFHLFSLSAEQAFLVNHGANIVSQNDTWWVIDGPDPLFYRVYDHPSVDLYNLRIAAGALHLGSNAAVSVNGTLQNDAGVQGLILHSDEFCTASLIHYNDGVEATIERFISAVYDWNAIPATDWHMISAPLSGQEIHAFVPDDQYSGYDFYGWCESSSTWVNFKNQNSFGDFNNGFYFNEGQGYLVAYEHDQLFSFIGTMHAGDVSCNNLTYTTTEDYTGWHLLGNPFASSLDWNAPYWQRTKVLDEVHVWDRYRGNYIFNNNGIGDFSGIIQPHMGIFIKVIDPETKNASLEMPSLARTHNIDPENRQKLPANSLRFEVQASDTPYRDAFFVLLRENGSDNFNPRHDAHKLNGMGHAPEIFSRKGMRNLSIHSLPATNDHMELPLWFRSGRPGQFIMRVTGIETVDDAIDIWLLDQHSKTATDLRVNSEIAFAADNATEEARFLLILNPTVINTTEPAPEDIKVYVCGEYINVQLPDHYAPSRLIVTATDGRQWLNEQLGAKGFHQFRKPPVRGLLVIQVFSKSATKTVKIINH